MNARAGFHSGEQAWQRLAGVQARLQALAPQILREFMPDQHRELFGKLPTLVLGALDAEGRPWATMLAGRPGFVSTPDERHMRIELPAAAATVAAAGDPVLASLQAGSPVGVLGLEPQTRRRNRMNGVVESLAPAGPLTIAVRQSFGNCPRYIVGREPEFRAPAPQAAQTLGPQLDDAAKALILASDTLFIASASARPRDEADSSEGVDVSHRGGKPGFVGLETGPNGEVLLTLPDYAGNQFFMTLGNLSVNPAAGLLWVDYTSGGLLQLTADAAIETREHALAGWPGAQRLVRLRIRGGVWRPQVLPWRWSAT